MVFRRYLRARLPWLMTFRYTTSVWPGSQRVSSEKSVFSVASTYFSPFQYWNPTFRLPDTILLTPVLAVSVNHAKVDPTSIATHSTSANTLASKDRLVVFLLIGWCFCS